MENKLMDNEEEEWELLEQNAKTNYRASADASSAATTAVHQRRLDPLIMLTADKEMVFALTDFGRDLAVWFIRSLHPKRD